MHRLVPALEAARATRSRKAKVEALAQAFRSIAAEDGSTSPALAAAARLVLGELGLLQVGWALVAESALAASGGTNAELSALSRTKGDLGDGVGDLMAAHASGQERPGLALAEIAQLSDALTAADSRDARRELLTGAFSRAKPDEARYFAKALLGELRIGVQLGILEEGIAKAFNEPLADLRKASALMPDIGELVQLAAQHRLGEASIRLGVPVAFMLASPTESVKTELDLSRTTAEDKLDGIRAQAHVSADGVRLFARGSGEVTQSFPEVVEALKPLMPGVILDGEIIAVMPDGRPRPFQALQQRLGRVAPKPELLQSLPVRYTPFDLLFDGESLLALPLEDRRARLTALLQGFELFIPANPVTRLDASQPLEPQIDALFDGARGRGHEGLVLKSLDSVYEAGRRGAAWRKVKRALATLDVVVTKAEWGHGKRTGVLSDYTFAVWKGEQLVDVGKAYSGLTDAEIAEMTKRLEALTLERHGGLHVVRPEVVLEVAFDGLQRSTRHDSGFALRFPRIARIRDDKKPAEANTLFDVEQMFQGQVHSGHREDIPLGATTQLTFDQET